MTRYDIWAIRDIEIVAFGPRSQSENKQTAGRLLLERGRIAFILVMGTGHDSD